ncbi:hypothetical protein BGZ80_009341 [Entomortierella chlamydospora]|uniref:Uncharacterized protein n=1 Tax=Entomortierella chlamydospora TaxID=101097 RepID=A0A9P6N355_9FUNG|nr:hypothetical protein BGZ79_003924 [Entomortierella chlamydospora]KAG0023474.1 hypothetical protein BGZ80_009341 [Entomortierella chlamydospora]
MDMDEYQTIEQRGVQDLVRVSKDEDGLPCVYLRDIDRIFPNTIIITTYGVRIPFSTDSSRTPKQPLRIPYFENRVLEVESDNSALEWSREATATRIAAAAAQAEAAFGHVNTVHTAQLPGILDDDDDGIDMVESGTSSSEVGESEEEEEEEEPLPRRYRGSVSNATTATTTTPTAVAAATTTLSPRPPTQSLRTVHSLTNISPELTSFTRDAPPSFDQISPIAVSPTTSHAHVAASIHHLDILEEQEMEGETLPSYRLIDPGTSQTTPDPESTREVIPPREVIDDPSTRHLVLQRVEIIKRTSQAILSQNYGAESCPHPPLFIILPENPLRWSFSNILHNKMRLHFLCDCCEHQININESVSDRGHSSKRNVHIDPSKGFELRMDQFQDQMLLVKFGHYILSLLRMLQYGVSIDNVFVAAAFDRPVPPVLSASFLGGNAGMDPQLFFRTKLNIERSIAFMEALLGDDYEDEVAEAVSCLDMNDFRILDWIIKRPPYTQSVKSESSTVGNMSPSTANIATMEADREAVLGDVHTGGSGLRKILGPDNRVRWGCQKYYEKHYQNLDRIFSSKLESLQVSLNPHTRSVVLVGASENHLNAKIIAVSKIKALFHVDITLDWSFEMSHLNTLSDILKRESTSVSSVAVKLTKRVPPMFWKKALPTRAGGVQPVGDDQPIGAIVNLIKNRRIRHLILEGDIDLMSVPNISTMDFTNLDILSIMKSSNRGFNYGPNNVNGSGNSIHSNDNLDMNSGAISSTNKGYNQETYISELISFLQSCSFLTELSLGFPDAIPGHVRILQACATSLTRLRRLDLFRVLGSKIVGAGTSSNGGSVINHKLELSASLSARRITRLYMAECKANGEGRVRLLESLEELLTDDGAYLEDLELRFIGFNDRHAHALELGTRPISEQHCTRLRRLVIHGKGLEHRGVSAMGRVLKRATLFSKFNRLSGDSSSSGVNPIADRGNSIGSSSSAQVAVGSTAATAQDSESSAYGNMWERPTLIHLELCSIDSLTDSDWAGLLEDLDLRRLITLHLQGVCFGDRAVAALVKTPDDEDDILDSTSPPQSPISDSFAHSSYTSSSSTSPPPPAFFSSSSPLPLQSLRLSCSALSDNSVKHFQGFLSRLVHLSAVSLHGFRKVTSRQWADLMARISFRWIEVIEIVSYGFDDDCARYLGERIRAREQTPESPTTSTSTNEFTSPSGLALPPYSAQPSTTTVAASVTSTTTTVVVSAAGSSSEPQISRRTSFTSRFFGTIPLNSSNSAAKQKNKDKEKPLPATPATPAQTVPSQKYLEVDLRYTDVSTNGLTLLRSMMIGQAQKVVVKLRDGGDESGDGMDALTLLTEMLNDDKDLGDKSTSHMKARLASPTSPTAASFSIRNSTSSGTVNNGMGSSPPPCGVHTSGGDGQGNPVQRSRPQRRTSAISGFFRRS